MKNMEQTITKSVRLPKSMWGDIATYRFENRITTEAEALRRIIQAVLKRAQRRGKKAG